MLTTATRRVSSLAPAIRSFSTAASSQVDVVLGSQWGDEGMCHTRVHADAHELAASLAPADPLHSSTTQAKASSLMY